MTSRYAPGGILLNLMLKIAFARARPGSGTFDLFGYNFPSGHTMTARLPYGLLGVFVAVAVKSWWSRAVTFALVFIHTVYERRGARNCSGRG